MTYPSFVDSQPLASQTINQFTDVTRENLMALRDAVVIGAAIGWDYTFNSGTAEQPTEIVYFKGTERLRGNLTWGTSGGADGNVTQAIWSYSSNSGGAYDTMGTESITYDVNGNVTGVSWS